jgi:hypothetical protein
LLVGGQTFARHRVAYLLAAVVVFSLPAVAWYVAARIGWVEWPAGSTELGLILGISAAVIIAFEMLIWPRKGLRGRRLGRTRVWMYWHVWLGLASLPLAVVHAGFRFGGPLTTLVLGLFLILIASGVWGLAMQQIIPRKLLNEFAAETIESEVDRVMAYHVLEADELVRAATAGSRTEPLVAFYADEVRPYLDNGRRSSSALRSAGRAAGLFADLAIRAPNATTAVRRLDELCAYRRQYDAQVRLHAWLHNWQLVHLPLSVALCLVLVVHIVTALKYW